MDTQTLTRLVLAAYVVTVHNASIVTLAHDEYLEKREAFLVILSADSDTTKVVTTPDDNDASI